ncbi:MAG: hypothetical protein NW214_02705 [Pseudanabaenaceae cyanobacterium bins.39]|nr:hypothetical protein [Pseudanabaenaceae cyanobacterium bins.39]
MRADLERLVIDDKQLLDLTGFDRQKLLLVDRLPSRYIKLQRLLTFSITIITFITFASVFVPALRFSGTIFLISLTLGALSLSIEFAEVSVICFVVAIASTFYSLYMLTGTTLGVILLCLGLAIGIGGCTFWLVGFLLHHRHKSKVQLPQNQIPKLVLRLFKEVDKYNKTIHEIDVFDQLQDAGNAIKLESREAAIAVLRMTRNDIVRAFKTERILRDNPDFHPDHFEIDLNAFATMQVNERAKEYAKIFDTSLQIAIDVQAAMADLQTP